MKKCPHQFFEVKYIQKMADIKDKDPNKIYLSYTEDTGKMVMCALCGEQRNLWESGKLEVKGDSND